MSNAFLTSLATVDRPIAELKSAKRRIRRSSSQQVEPIVRSIQAHGFVGPTLVAGDEVVDGYLRVEAVAALGASTIHTIDVSHLSATQLQSLMIAVNCIAETGEWDFGELRVALAELIATAKAF